MFAGRRPRWKTKSRTVGRNNRTPIGHEQLIPRCRTPRFSNVWVIGIAGGSWRRERDSNPRYGFPYSGFQLHGRVLTVLKTFYSIPLSNGLQVRGFDPFCTDLNRLEHGTTTVLLQRFRDPLQEGRHDPIAGITVGLGQDCPVTRPESAHQTVAAPHGNRDFWSITSAPQ